MMTKKISFLLSLSAFILLIHLFHADAAVLQKYRKNSISDRDLQGAASRWFTANKKILPGQLRKPGQSMADTVKLNVLAIRVEFPEDDDPFTTGNGRFDLSQSEALMINPPPHNHSYFDAQLKALSNYYRKVSHNKLILKGFQNIYGDVFPAANDVAYQLPRNMAYYGINENDELRDKRLTELFHDAWKAADADNAIEFTQYDCFIVFHAGVGGDFAFDFDETPYDIASAFLSFSDLKQNLGSETPDYQGISVRNGSVIIRDGIILPETQSQYDLEFGLLGTAALMFGSQIGLPSLFNVETGHSGIGKWGLMDQGSGNYTGLLPAQPCAWSKVFMGWVEPVTISSGNRIPIAATLAKNPNKIYKIPINTQEYFLLENRQQHMLKVPDLAVAYDQNGVRVELYRDGTIAQSAEDEPFQVLVNVDELDFDCPGSGILIWHIDEQVILEKYAANKINTDPDHRGVALEEAHGSQDIGGSYGFLHPASGSENGIAENAFWKDNLSNQEVNDTTKVAFTPTSTPGSRSNSRANSHISITNFSKIDSVMYFDLQHSYHQTGFPFSIGKKSQLTPNSIIAMDLTNDGANELFATATDGKIFAWKNDGSKLIENSYYELHENLRHQIDTISVALFASIEDSILLAPTITNFSGNQVSNIVVGSAEGNVYCWLPQDEDQNGEADLLDNFPVQLQTKITTPLLAAIGMSGEPMILAGLASGELAAIGKTGLLWRKSITSGVIAGLAFLPTQSKIAVTGAAGALVLIDVQGNSLWEKTIAASGSPGLPVAGDLDANASTEIIVPLGSGEIVIYSESGELLQQITLPHAMPLKHLALGDLNKNGFIEIVAVLGDEILVYTHTGVMLENFPVKLVWHSAASSFQYASAVLGDIDNDDDLEIIVGDRQGSVQAFHHNGQMVDGFPFSTDGALKWSPLLTDFDADGDTELIIGSAASAIYGWDLAGEYNSENIPWGHFSGNFLHWAFAATSAQPAAAEGTLLAAAYNYPNPTEGNSTTIRFELATGATVNIRIFDLAGKMVYELSDISGIYHAPNEIIWELDNIESGVYLARIEATSVDTGETVEKIIKIAVVK